MHWNFLKRWMPVGTPLVHDWKEVLFVACENDDAKLVTRALAHHASPDAVEAVAPDGTETFWQGMSAIAVAIQFGSWNAVRALLDGGVPVRATTLYPYAVAWAGKQGKSWTHRVPVFCLAVARLAGQTQNAGEVLLAKPGSRLPSPAATMETVLNAFLDHGGDPEEAYDLMVSHPTRGNLLPPGPPRRPIDHLAIDHPLILPHLSVPLLQRMGARTERPDSPLHLLSRSKKTAETLMAGTVALVQAGVSPYTLDSTGHSALHHLAQSMGPDFFITLLERLPDVQLHGFPDLNGYSALDTLRHSVVVQTDSDRATLAQVDALAQRSMDNAQAPLRAVLTDVEAKPCEDAPPLSARWERQRL